MPFWRNVVIKKIKELRKIKKSHLQSFFHVYDVFKAPKISSSIGRLHMLSWHSMVEGLGKMREVEKIGALTPEQSNLMAK